MAFFLAFDAGGTKTTCALADDSRALARASGGSIKPLRVSIQQAQQNLSALLGEVSRQSGVDLRKVAVSCIGTAGLRLPQTRKWMEEILSGYVGGEIVISGDEETALDAAFPGQAGVLIIGGTGSNILGRTNDGRTFTVGGWGPALADEGSGYWIGHEALRAALHAYDFQRRTIILDRVGEFWSAPTLGDIANIANATPPPDFSLLAPLIVECAEADDAVALDILRQGGYLLGECAAHAVCRLRTLEPDMPVPGIAFVGSIIQNVAFVRESMIETIRRSHPSVYIVPEAVDPIQGALWRARQAIRH
jgi:glucosamine kinase